MVTNVSSVKTGSNAGIRSSFYTTSNSEEGAKSISATVGAPGCSQVSCSHHQGVELLLLLWQIVS